MERNRQPNGDERRRRKAAGKCEDCGGDPFPKPNDYCWCPLKGEEKEISARLKEIESLKAKLAASEGKVRVAKDALKNRCPCWGGEPGNPEGHSRSCCPQKKALALIDRPDSEVKGEK